MNKKLPLLALVAALTVPFTMAHAGKDSDTAALFRNADQSAGYFANAYGYAVFPTIGKGGLGIGAAHGSGHVYAHGHRTGRVTMNQLSIGFQAGGEAYSEIIFFKDRAAFENFTSGNFEFSADAGVVVITAAAQGTVGTSGAGAGASVGKTDAAAAGSYDHGMAVFTIAKGGLMYNATIAGQKFSYTPNHAG